MQLRQLSRTRCSCPAAAAIAQQLDAQDRSLGCDHRAAVVAEQLETRTAAPTAAILQQMVDLPLDDRAERTIQ
jgi:hypothetical protein